MKAKPILLLWALPAAWAQYAGPAILTRGEQPPGMTAASEARLRPFLEVTGLYDSGLANVAVNSSGQLADQSSAGVGLAWGVSGNRRWRYTELSMEYRGSLNHYTNSSAFDSIDQSLRLSLRRQLARHVSLSVNTDSGMFTRNPGAIASGFDSMSASIPTNEFFDNRTMFVDSMADPVIQKSARLSFDLGGQSAVVRRRSASLDGTTTANAHGDAQYRITRHVTIGAAYGYYHFDYSHIFGGTDVHTASSTFAVRLSPRWELSGFGGIARAESQFVQTGTDDPVIASLIGSAHSIYTLKYVPHTGARLARTFRHGAAYISGGRTVSPGNGLFLTSYASSASGGYTYTGVRRWSLGMQASYAHLRSVGSIEGVYTNLGGGFTASRQILPTIHFVSSYSIRQYRSPDFANYNRLVQEARVGFGWTPGDAPLRFW